MHRQSLGSPASKLHIHNAIFTGTVAISDDISPSSSSSSSASVTEERKSLHKPLSYSSSSSTNKLIHLIPLLTFLCFLILYLSSHDPSRTDFANVTSGFTAFSSKKSVIDSIDLDDNIGGGFLEIEKNDVITIRSMRNLQQQERHRFHRKFGQ
uniref:uncharacterized protein LOC122584923 n=1 Tax=Erigeron canadensis TaxID=72917 RepID=UPI001CB98839|nr:uncharacterized protein LOC122584923 [Erigeron canadensis]